MRVDEEDPGLLLDRFEVRIEQSFPPLVELSNKCHVWVTAWSFSSTEIETVIVSHLGRKNDVCNHYRSRSGNTLHAMNQHSSSLVLSALNKIDGVVKNARDIFMHMVLQMITLIFDALFLVIILAVVCCAVDHMSNSLVA